MVSAAAVFILPGDCSVKGLHESNPVFDDKVPQQQFSG